MKNILVAIDFSDNSTNALEYGINLNKTLKANMVLYHAYFVAMPATDIPDPLPSDILALEYASEALNKFKNKYQGLFTSMSFKSMVSEGYAENEMPVVQTNAQADLLIIGSHGKTGIRNIVVGNTARKIMKRSLCPVIVVPAHFQFKQLNKIVFAANYGEDDFKNVVDLIDFARPFNSEIILVHINTGTTSKAFDFNQLSGFTKQLKEENKYEKISFKLLDNPDVFEGLHSFTEEINADMLSISMRSKALFTRLFDHGLTDRVIKTMNIPVMVFHTS